MAIKAKGKQKAKPKAVKKHAKESAKKKPNEKQELPARVVSHTAGNSTVPTVEIKAVMEDTFERVYQEIYPREQLRDHRDRLNGDFGEEAYILRLYMLLGSPEDTPRTGLKIRAHEYSGVPDCGKHE